MIHAYDDLYLEDAMKCLGEAMDYVANSCNMEMDYFLELFIGSGFAKQFEVGVPRILSGMSGIELAMDVLAKVGFSVDEIEKDVDYEFSSEYWCGWILAYYQWYTRQSFKHIQKNISMHEIHKLYPVLHEASESKFVNTINRIIRNKNLPTRLQTQRKICGYSQSELSKKVGINLRTLQQYEIRGKDINKASVTTLLSLAKNLGCQIEDILEYDYRELEDND